MYAFILQKRNFVVAIRTTQQKSWKVLEFHQKPWKSPGTLMKKVLEKAKKSPGKSWNLNQFFWWEPCY